MWYGSISTAFAQPYKQYGFLPHDSEVYNFINRSNVFQERSFVVCITPADIGGQWKNIVKLLRQDSDYSQSDSSYFALQLKIAAKFKWSAWINRADIRSAVDITDDEDNYTISRPLFTADRSKVIVYLVHHNAAKESDAAELLLYEREHAQWELKKRQELWVLNKG